MHLTIRHKLYGLGLLGLATAIGAGTTGLQGISQVAADTSAVTALIAPIRNHLQAGIFLDITRADVSKMMTASKDAQDGVAAEVADHQKLLAERFAAANSYSGGGAAGDALQKEKMAVDAYQTNLTQLIASRKDPAAAMKVMGDFLRGYQDLRDQMQNTDDALAGEAKAAENRVAAVVRRSNIVIASMCLLSSLLILVIASRIAQTMNARLGNVIGRLKGMAEGDLTMRVEDTQQDELGEIANWFNDSMAKLREAIAKVARSASSVTSATEALGMVSQKMTTDSARTTSRAAAAASATDKVNRNLQTVATATEEMSASIDEIAKNASEAAKVAGTAMKTAEETNAIVSKLGTSSAEISQVIKVITSIAQKTDLLALNATVEAARAGEVGAGFAVVANEVKDLAKQTASATEDISQKIEAIQSDAKAAVAAIKTISGIIDSVNQISSTIATAVEEQSATTRDMSRNLTEAARGSGDATDNINGAAQAAADTSSGAMDSQNATTGLTGLAEQLRELVGQFKIDERDSKNGHSTRGYSVTTRDKSVSTPETEEVFSR
jgi:methyl-accepting chemotaxis protein